MSFSKTDAFNALGYNYQSTRGVWTAERDGRVLVTLWQRLIRYDSRDGIPFLYVDLNELEADGFERIARLPDETKHHKRAERLKKAKSGQAELDLVVLLGPVDNSEGHAFPWIDEQNDGFTWRVIYVDDETGHYRLEARKNWR